MAPRQRWEARLALGMLPAGGVMTLVSVAAFVWVALLALDTLVRRPAAMGWLLAWCLAATAAAARNVVKSLETMSSLEWRPLVQVALLSCLVLVAYPGWWVHG